MECICKSAFSTDLLKELEITGLGTLVSIQKHDEIDIITIDIGPLEIPQYPVAKVNRIERVEIESL